MLKKTHLLGIALSLFSASGFCSSFYVGAGVGPESANIYEKTQAIHVTALDFVGSSNISATGVFGSIFGGYQYSHNRFYVAGELNANTSSTEGKIILNDIDTPSNSSTVTLKMKHNYGVSIIPGFLLTDATLFFARLGYVNSNLSVSSSAEGLKGFNANLSGVRFGAGIKQAISKRCAVRLEYSQANYEGHSSQVIVSSAPLDMRTTRFTPQTGQVEFGLIYNFV